MTESQIHKAIVQHLRTRAVPGVVWWHTPNGGYRDIREAAKFKSLGVRAGVSDIVLFTEYEKFALELKADGGRPTEAQLAFQSSWRDLRGHAVVAEGLDQAIMCLEGWGLLK